MKIPNRRLRVFICHAPVDQPIARDLHAQLLETGWMDIWFIESSLTIYDNWAEEIRWAVNEADTVIALISNSSFKQVALVYPEPNFAFSILDARPADDFQLIPLRLGRSGIPAEIVRDALDYLPKNQRKNVGKQVLSALAGYASERGFSLDEELARNDPTPGLQWTPTHWRQVGGLFLDEPLEEDPPAPKTTRSRPKWIGRISTGLSRLIFSSLTIIVLFAVVGVALIVRFVNTGQSVNSIAEPIISGALTLIPLPTPTPGVGSVQVSPVDGMRMVYVPAGEFILGSDEGAEDERPARTMNLAPYWIDQYEVTNGMYKKCVEYRKCNPPDYRGANAWVHRDLIPLLEPIIRFYDDPRYADYPISRITWDDAGAYCSWVGRRLPTEAEWEKAARGTDGRTFPWGEDVDCTKANVYTFPADEACTYAPTRVGSYEKGVSPYGAYDMAGNVFEFVSDDYELTFVPEDGFSTSMTVDFYRLQKGGSWITSGAVARSANRELWNTVDVEFDPNFVFLFDPDGQNGFRCASSVDAPVAQPISTPTPAVQLDPQISPIDGMSIVYVPAGEFIMGSDYFEEDEKPAHRVYLDAFWIDQFEVTKQQYAECVQAGICNLPFSYFRLDEHFSDPLFASHPVTGATWDDAVAYCGWAGRRLPTEAEWEKAARGSVGQMYPWGEEISCSHANYNSCHHGLLPVGSLEKGRSPFGTYDMSGNALEWVADWYDEHYYKETPFANPTGPAIGQIHVYKSGFWGNSGDVVRPANRFAYVAYIPFGEIGFRCATSADEPVVTQTMITPALQEDGHPQISPLDGMQMVHVPAGAFIMGGEAYFEEGPIHTVTLDAFWIDQTEVTNSMFASFLTAWGNREEGGVPWFDMSDEDARIHFYAGIWRADLDFENRPVVEVNWYGANAYCSWAGRRLPTEAEWEKAARGTSSETFPWGNANPTADLLNFNEIVGNTTPVGAYPQGMSPYGALDMAGNVWEWVADIHSRTYYSNSPLENPLGPDTGFFRVMRGGGWNSRDTFVRSMHRNRGVPTISHDFVGFRCALSAK